ncbi:MAG: regulatory protein RecX [Marinobacter sp.]|uniref:regulatory protein RecX n=1 Tax=Marinobacter sp. TaxID=50741 RepID=UPI00349FDBB2
MAIDKNQDDPEQKARASALRLLARREHSRQELILKLRQRQTPETVIDRVLDDYEQEGWLSDERFAEVYSRQRRDLGYGPVRIRSELQQRGVRLWPDCLSGMVEAEWVALAIQARQKKFGLGDIAGDWTEKARQARFLSQRGYSGEQVEQALEAQEGPEI